MASNSTHSALIVVPDYRQLVRELNTIDPNLRKQFIKDAKTISKPVETAIKSNLPKVAPLSGMYEKGRLGWDVGVAHDKTTLKFTSKRGLYKAITPLVSVWVRSPLVTMLDMAGRGAGAKYGFTTREYPYKNGLRRHRINGQGAAMLRRLGGKGSRFVYPAGERALPSVEQQMKNIITVLENQVTRRNS